MFTLIEELNSTRAPILAVLKTFQVLNLLSSLVLLKKPVFYSRCVKIEFLVGLLSIKLRGGISRASGIFKNKGLKRGGS